MEVLSELQKKQLIAKEPNISAEVIKNYILKYGNLELSDFPNMNSDKKVYIADAIRTMPNPIEQQQWNDILSLKTNGPSDELLGKLSAYIHQWESCRPNGNHVDEANELYTQVENELIEIKIREEENDWQLVDPMKKSSLKGHLRKYPNSAHKGEIDDLIWDLTQKDKIFELEEYITIFPDGNHVAEANSILEAMADWEDAKKTKDIFVVKEYIDSHDSSPFIGEARKLLMTLKQDEIAVMRRNLKGYEPSRLFELVDKGIFTDNELIDCGVVTENILTTLREGVGYLPDLNAIIAKTVPECKEGYTDVYFLGIPNTGKSCVLMGLSSSDRLNVDLATAGGNYAGALQQFIEAGCVIPPTPDTFTTNLEATIRSSTKCDAVHKVNLIEMSGEEFAFKIVHHPDDVFDFKDMGGSKVANLLTNGNRKVFFIVVDPTTNVVRVKHAVKKGFNEETGEPIYEIEYINVNQRIALQKIINIFAKPENIEIMKKVDCIHFIVTKSDILGNAVEREEKALNIFRQKYENKVLQSLYDLCENFNINCNTNYRPKLYTFSLGNFYIGDFYEYDSTDSNRLVDAIVNSTEAIKKETFWDKVRRMVN